MKKFNMFIKDKRCAVKGCRNSNKGYREDKQGNPISSYIIRKNGKIINICHKCFFKYFKIAAIEDFEIKKDYKEIV